MLPGGRCHFQSDVISISGRGQIGVPTSIWLRCPLQIKSTPFRTRIDYLLSQLRFNVNFRFELTSSLHRCHFPYVTIPLRTPFGVKPAALRRNVDFQYGFTPMPLQNLSDAPLIDFNPIPRLHFNCVSISNPCRFRRFHTLGHHILRKPSRHPAI